MASTAAATSSASSSSSSAGPQSLAVAPGSPVERRPQAGPLPSKRGEIGYSEAEHAHLAQSEADVADAALPDVHPADRDAQRAQQSSASSPGTPHSSHPPPNTNTTTASTTPPSNDSSSALAPKPRIKRWYESTYGGVRLATFLRLAFQLLLLGGTIAAWVIIVQHVMRSQNNSSSSSSSSGSDSNSSDSDSSSSNNVDQILGPGMVNLFIYVAFGVAALLQLLFLERTVFHLRAERYVFLHPGEMLTRGRGRSGPGHGAMFMTASAPGMGFAPWNRPPLPTYAAALAQSGLGTGDVEDNIIAIAPPPEYGNTRGSTLILANLLIRSNSTSSRSRSVISARSDEDLVERGERHASQMSQMSGRPLSYVSHDEEWEQRRSDAERARILEAALAKLEDSAESTQPSQA